MAVNSVDVFDVVPEGVIELDVDRRGLSTPASSGAVQSRQVRTGASEWTERAETRSWRLNWRHGTWLQRNNIKTILDNSYNGAAPIDWTPPDEGSAIQVRALGDTFTVTWWAPQSYAMSIVLEEFI